jgi:enoyl-CoA hydratase/carnithine racemase
MLMSTSGKRIFSPVPYNFFLMHPHHPYPISLLAPLALRAAKMAILRASEVPLEVGLDFERACYAPLLRSRDRDEALEAFRDKRKPVFLGQ